MFSRKVLIYSDLCSCNILNVVVLNSFVLVLFHLLKFCIFRTIFSAGFWNIESRWTTTGDGDMTYGTHLRYWYKYKSYFLMTNDEIEAGKRILRVSTHMVIGVLYEFVRGVDGCVDVSTPTNRLFQATVVIFVQSGLFQSIVFKVRPIPSLTKLNLTII